VHGKYPELNGSDAILLQYNSVKDNKKLWNVSVSSISLQTGLGSPDNE